jgi:3-hydroxybutyryl-CoA dehydrogenase
MPDNSRSIAVIGAGLMGTVIAASYASQGYRVVVCARDGTKLAGLPSRALPFATALLGSEQAAKHVLGDVTTTTELEEAVQDAFLVQESIHEDLTAKRDLFRQLDSLCGPDVVLATNTSSLLLSDICQDLTHKDRVLGIHYVMPAHIVKVVEVIQADFTRPGLVDWARGFLTSIGHEPVVCHERPGFLINRLQYAMLCEAYRILDEGYATVEDIDAAVRLSIGPRLALWGPLMTQDLVASKATSIAALTYLHEQTGEPQFRPRTVLRDLVAQGAYGAAAGCGWYPWTSAPYPEVVERRDALLSELLQWLAKRAPHQAMRAGPQSPHKAD